MLGDERLELRDEPPVPALRQVGFDAHLNGFEPELLEAANLCLQPGDVGNVGVRPAVPPAESDAEQVGGLIGSRGQLCPGLVDGVLEGDSIDFVGFDHHRVCRANPVDLQSRQRSEIGDVGVERGSIGGGGGFAPDSLEKNVSINGTARCAEQHGKHGALLLAAEVDLCAVLCRRHRAQDSISEDALHAGYDLHERISFFSYEAAHVFPAFQVLHALSIRCRGTARDATGRYRALLVSSVAQIGIRFALTPTFRREGCRLHGFARNWSPVGILLVPGPSNQGRSPAQHQATLSLQ
jgi:hypothetical protein